MSFHEAEYIIQHWLNCMVCQSYQYGHLFDDLFTRWSLWGEIRGSVCGFHHDLVDRRLLLQLQPPALSVDFRLRLEKNVSSAKDKYLMTSGT